MYESISLSQLLGHGIDQRRNSARIAVRVQTGYPRARQILGARALERVAPGVAHMQGKNRSGVIRDAVGEG
jgi:hypothetical protein